MTYPVLRAALRRGALAGCLGIAAFSAHAAVALPGGDPYLNGDIDFSYGETGLGYLVVYLYTGDLASTEAPTLTDSTTSITYDYSLDGFGSSLASITYTLGNEGPQTFTDLRFIVQIQADGSNTFLDAASTLPSPWGPAMTGDPAHFQLAEFSPLGLNQAIVSNNGLNDSDACGGECDIDFALQWNLASLAPGEIYTLTIGLSDAGQMLSGRGLQAISVNSANTALTFSGTLQAAPIPAPAAVWLFASGLGVIAGRVRSRGAKSSGV